MLKPKELNFSLNSIFYWKIVKVQLSTFIIVHRIQKQV